MATVTLAEYLFTRLKQCGLTTIFGVPGDYNLQLLDHVEPQGLNWVGNCNELNAGYAADGYARVKGIGAVITTFGVGELSAINAIAGAFAEKAPVVHIVGIPPRKTITDKLFVHHTLGDGDYTHFAKMYEHVTVAQARLWELEEAPRLIDEALAKCLEQHRPVYISVPDDAVNELVKCEKLSTNLQLQTIIGDVPNMLAERVYSSKNPRILIDGECFGMTKEINEFIEKTKWPTFVTPFGKSIVNEELPNFCGIWDADAKLNSKDCDLLLCFGPHWSNTNSAIFMALPDLDITISLNSSGVRYLDQHWECSFKSIMSTLLGIDAHRIAQPTKMSKITEISIRQDDLINQKDFYKTLSRSGLFRSGDNIMAETGTASNGSRDFRLPKDALLFNAVTWLSIGYMLPAALGVSLARSSRTILLIGDGSFQMTAQEFSTIIREKLDFLLILINNDGYTIERCIHGKDEKYNDVAKWNYLQALQLFGGGADNYPVRSASARTWTELEDILGAEKASSGPSCSMIEVFMDKEDAPQELLALLKEQYTSN